MAGATLGSVVGPFGAAAGGIAGGIYVDGITTQIESGITSEYRPNGVFYVIDRVKNKEISAGELFDAAIGVSMDGLAGKNASEFLRSKSVQPAANQITGKQLNKVAKGSKSSLQK